MRSFLTHTPQLFRSRATLLALLPVLLLLPHTAVMADDEEFPGVGKLMSETEYREAGLDKLSPAELDALNDWLIRYTAGEATVLQQTNEVVREAERELEVNARLGDDFDGWSGKTVFRLNNGQIWKQRLDGSYRYRGPANPEVSISKNWLGFYKMTLVESGKSVGVTRLR